MNIVDGRLIYQRQKTHGCINQQLADEVQQLVAKYTNYQQQADYLFSILHYKRHITPMQKNNLVHKLCHQVNQDCQRTKG